MVGLILDTGHVGKPSPNERDRGAVLKLPHGDLVEADLVVGYLAAAEEAAAGAGVIVEVIAPPTLGWSYDRRHRQAIAIARAQPAVRWLYVQGHVNSAERDARYGLVGHDPRSSAGAAAAVAVAAALREALVPAVVTRVRVEAAVAGGPWSRMLTTIDGVYEGPDNLCGICLEPLFIQSTFLAAEAGRAAVLRQIGHALVAGVVAWGAAR